MRDKVKYLIKDNYKQVIFLILFAVFCFYDTGYSIYKPGGTISINDRIEADDMYESAGSFNMAYVGYMKGTLPFYLISYIIPSWERVSNDDIKYDNETIEDASKRDKINYDAAISDAIYVAYNKAGAEYSIKDTKYYVTYLSEDNISDIKIGDEIDTYDDINYTDINAFKDYINDKYVGYEITLGYTRDDKEYTTKSTIYEDDGILYAGIGFDTVNEYETYNNLVIKTKESESGPSGGLLMTLAIYNAITEEDITHGKKIVGTGTIDEEGNVGEIGGVTYKLAAAVKTNADLFICPTANLAEALDYSNKMGYDIIIKGVDTFEDALLVLEG